MEKKDWTNESDEYIEDEITLAFLVLKKVPENEKISEKNKQNLIDECLDKLNTLYNEQRKRGTFKGDSRTA